MAPLSAKKAENALKGTEKSTLERTLQLSFAAICREGRFIRKSVIPSTGKVHFLHSTAENVLDPHIQSVGEKHFWPSVADFVLC